MHVYCNGWNPKNLIHEVMLTSVLLPFDQLAIIKRGNCADQKTQADAVMKMAGHTYYIEMDTGSVHHPQQKRRWKRYRHISNDFLLVVTTSETRLLNLIDHAGAVANIALFTTLDQAVGSPFASIWRGCQDGQTVALPTPAATTC